MSNFTANSTNGVNSEAENNVDSTASVTVSPSAKESTPQTPATQSSQSSSSSGKTSQGTNGSGSATSSSGGTVDVTGSSQEVTSDTSDPPNPAVWGIIRPLQPEFIQLELINDRYTFGRAQEADYCFDMPSIKKHKHHKLYSKMHFAIKRTVNPDGMTERVIFEDLGATNGTFINGDKVPSKKQRSIENLDKIALSYCWSNIFMFIDTQKKVNPDLPVSFSKKYILHKSIGKGACGEVFETWLRDGVGQFACKVISKARLSLYSVSVNSANRDAMSEARLLRQLKHPCIIGVEDVIDSPKNLYIILEYAAGGELFERLSQEGLLQESLAKLYFYQMLCAVAYLHENGITHRDLKPENILLMSKDEPTLLKITDFGMSRLVEEQSLMRTLAGTPSYLAPEILKRIGSQSSPGYTKLVDMWSLGVLLYVCLVAYPPFSSGRKDTQQDINQQILSANFNFKHTRWDNVSPPAKQLVCSLLKLNASERLNPTQALAHKWLDDSSMRKKAAELMMVPGDDVVPRTHTVNINLMGEKSLSSDSTSTRKVSTDNDERQLSGDGANKLSESDMDKGEAPKRAIESSDYVQTKHVKLE